MNKLAVGSVILFLTLLVVGCSELKDDLPPAGGTLTVHGTGWTDTTASNFHGKAIRSAGWDMIQCKTCHGQRYDGGTANVSCLTCHTQAAGPENCTTCHGGSNNAAPPKDINRNTARTAPGVGAHQMHLVGGTLFNGTVCSDCHNVPPSVYSPGHLDSPLPAEVPMNGYIPRTVTNEPTTADWDSVLPVFTPSPNHSSVDLSCGNTYCHGHFKNGNTTNAPVWNSTATTQAACGTCHGDVNAPGTLAARALPKTSARGGTHPSDFDCASCHSQVVSGTGDNVRIIDKALHVNGKLNVFGQERDF